MDNKVEDVAKGNEIPAEPETAGESSASGDFRIPSLESASEHIASGKLDATKDTAAVAQSAPPLRYQEPSWASVPDSDYYLEVLKNGAVVNKIDLALPNKSFYTVGRLPGVCDICAEHPTCSRFHAVLQFGRMSPEEKEGFYLHDLGSTHGSFLNKNRVPAEKYERLHVGHVMKFGSSTRLYVMQGPAEDEEEESAMSVTELKAVRKAELERLASGKSPTEAAAKESEDSGVDWGFGPDAVDEAPEKEVGFLETPSLDESYYADDPAKALKAFFIREGMEMEHDIEEVGQGRKRQFHCTIPLPLETPNGRQIMAEATVDGKKKDALAAAILEACRILHAKGALKGTTQIGKQKKARNWADEDFYDSDEDTFLDRTGTVEKKREQRIQRSGKGEQTVETFESLTKRHEELKKEMSELTENLRKADENKKASMGDGGVDALDNFMDAIKTGLIMDPKTKIKLRQRLTELKQEEARLVKLINLTKPLDLPAVMPSFSAYTSSESSYGRLKAAPLPPQKAPVFVHEPEKVIVEEEDETEEKNGVPESKTMVRKLWEEASSTVDLRSGPLQTTDTSPPVTEKRKSALRIEEEASLAQSSVDVTVATGSLAELQPYIQPSKKRKPEARKAKYEYDASDPDYAMWIPPEDQAGDGKLSLNEKLGY